MSRKAKEEYYRFYTVTEPRTHEKGYTEYKVTARFVSKKRPEDVKEIVAWRRYSELKKLHGELSYTHRNLFRRQEEFPPFPRAQVFGRFDEAVIEERRQAAEAMLLFTTHIPALYNSPQLKDFFRGGEVRRPLDSTLPSSTCLPPPLIPLPQGPAQEERGTEAPAPPQEAQLEKPEEALEAYGAIDSSPIQSDSPDTESSPEHTAAHTDQSQSLEEFDSLFTCVEEGPLDLAPPPLSQDELAIFDPCVKEDQLGLSQQDSELLSLPLCESVAGNGEQAAYLCQAASELKTALEKESQGEVSQAILKYKTAVDMLIKGAQGDPDMQRRESVKRKTAQYLEHAERLLSLHTPPDTQEPSV